jgi:subtilisin family serine protease
MKICRHLGTKLLLAFRFALPFATLSLALVSVAHAATVPREVLVKLRSAADLAPIIASSGAISSTQFGTRPIYRLTLPVGTNVDAVVAALTADTVRVLLAEANFVHQSPEGNPSRAWSLGSATQYTAQWAPSAIKLTDAHKVTTGGGVRVAVLDTGVDLNHPALAGKLLPGYDFVDGDADPTETCTLNDTKCGHGTHVAALVSLVAPDARVIPYRVLDGNGQGNVWVLQEAIQRAIDDGAQIINLSLGAPDVGGGSSDQSRVLASTIKLLSCEPEDTSDPITDYSDPSYSGDKTRCLSNGGLVFVAAAGNDGSVSVKQYPAATSAYGLISVTASNQSGQIANFGNFGAWVQVAAPGDGITSAVPTSATPGGFATWSGTSMATPIIAGAAALIRGVDRSMPAKDVVRRIERSSAIRLSTTTGQNTGIRLLDAAALVQRCNLDVDGDGFSRATTDGLAILRAMLGMNDASIGAATAAGSPQRDGAAIKAHLESSCGLLIP